VIGGTTKGDIHLSGYQVSIEKDGNVEAEIQAESALIKGTFRGNLSVNGLVKIEETAYFEGDLKAARLHLEDGAKLKGVIDLHTD
jgi:cytoskeletal protein CcmA (bactofilin family)